MTTAADKEEDEPKYFLSDNRKATMSKNLCSYNKYMDKMNQSLN